MNGDWKKKDPDAKLVDAGLQDIFHELASRSRNFHVDQVRATRDLPGGGVEVYPYWHTTVTFIRDDPGVGVFTIDRSGNEDDSDIDVGDHELRHGPPDV